LRNPLYHWTHLELKFPFGVRDQRLGPDTAREIYDHCNQRLAQDGFTTQGLLKQYGVVVVCSTDDPVDDLEPHRRHAQNPRATTKLFPTWRPDKALGVHDLGAWNAWVDKLEGASNVSIGSFDSFMEALGKRHDFFHETGCRASDHGVDRIFAADYTPGETHAIFGKARARRPLAEDEIDKLRSALLYDFAVMDHARGWVQQFHLGAARNNSSRAVRTLGPDTGYDSIGDLPQGATLIRFLDRLDSAGCLAKTILYNLNPADNEVLASAIGSFQDGSAPGKMQFGSAWWFLDQLDGMEKQINALSNLGLLARFVGMLTDSRSFLSYSRHEYFRRLLCNLIGRDVDRGLLPDDRALLGKLVENVCFRNARDYFQFRV
jgi:glucuronate isomerase